jgi:bifunctional DNase/RNase
MEQQDAPPDARGEMVLMVVAGITLDPSNNMPIIILKDAKGDTAIPIWIGLVEASAIATELEGIKLARPMTHDLFKNVIEVLGARLKKIEVSDLKENTFFAIMYLDHQGTLLEIDARPSDAIALAIRTNAEIYVARKVIEGSQQVDLGTIKELEQAATPGEAGDKKDKWSQILESLRPEDFGKYKM